MEFSLSDDQLLLKQTAERWAADHFGASFAAQILSGKQPSLEDSWRQVAEVGWPGLIVPADQDGGGGTMLDACLVVEALASQWSPLPLGGNLVAAAALRHLGGDEASSHLAALVTGERRYSLLLGEDLQWPPTGARGIAWEWLPGDGVLVPDGDGLAVAGAEVQSRWSQDLLRSLGTVELDAPGVSRPPCGGGGADLVLASALVVTSASLLGIMGGALHMAVEHAKNRVQFGRPIGSFQAVQHICAEMLVDVESSRAAVYGAAWTVDNCPPPEALRSAAVAKAWTTSAGIRVAEQAIQVLGGMAITWEVPAHLHLRAAHLLSAAFSNEARALDAVADHLFREAL